MSNILFGDKGDVYLLIVGLVREICNIAERMEVFLVVERVVRSKVHGCVGPK